MPNWTNNSITAKKKILKQYINEEGNFDFNLIYKMPEELNITAGGNQWVAIMAFLTEKGRLTIEDATKKLPALRLLSTEKVLQNSYDRLVKADEENKNALYAEGEKYVSNYENYGAFTWYEWCIENWGTKWNASDTYFDDEADDDEVIAVDFQTAWNYPEPIADYFVEVVSPEYPDDTITWTYVNEDEPETIYTLTIENGDVEETEEIDEDELYDEDFEDYEDLGEAFEDEEDEE